MLFSCFSFNNLYLILSLQKCYICNEGNANIGCEVLTCKRTFHRLCGLKANCEFTFKEPLFVSYCEKHVQIKAVDFDENKDCAICHESIQTFSAISPIKCDQCASFFHNLCLMKQALGSGNHFKCSMCANYESFRDHCKERGVYIPER